MPDFLEIVAMLCIIILICVLISLGVAIDSYTSIQPELYAECITTDYDKFQCYAMIYGDK